jgi:hypothetical protein
LQVSKELLSKFKVSLKRVFKKFKFGFEEEIKVEAFIIIYTLSLSLFGEVF